MSQIPVIEDSIVLHTKRDVLKLHLLTKLRERNIHYTEAELDVLVELSEFGGYNENTETEFLNQCISKNYRKSLDSTANVISKHVKTGVLIKSGLRRREVNKEFLPTINSSFVGLSYKIINQK